MNKAIALLEVQAMVTAITGLDAMLKAADVRLMWKNAWAAAW